MDTEKNKPDSSQKMTGEPGSASAAAQKVLDRGAEAYGQAEKVVSDVYDKTAEALNKTYEQAKSYSTENPGKTLLIAFGIGLGLGLSWVRVQAPVPRVQAGMPNRWSTRSPISLMSISVRLFRFRKLNLCPAWVQLRRSKRSNRC